MFAVMPNPQAPETFQAAKLKWDEIDQPPHSGLFNLYKEALRWRRRRPPHNSRDRVRVEQVAQTVAAVRWDFEEESWLLLFTIRGAAFGLQEEPFLSLPHASWKQVLDSNELRFGGQGAMSFDVENQRIDLRVPSALLLVSDHKEA
jgi:maltooligosyltrehalose trehalohydrolase